MTLKSTISLYIFFFLSLQTFVFAGSPDDPNSNPADTNKINSSSFSSFINSMDELGFKNIYFKQAPDDYKKIVENKFINASKSNNASDIIIVFESEMAEQPQYAYQIYNSALLQLYSISPRLFKKNSTALKNVLVSILNQPKNPVSNLTYSSDIDCWDENNYEVCKKLYSEKKEFWWIAIIFAILMI